METQFTWCSILLLVERLYMLSPVDAGSMARMTRRELAKVVFGSILVVLLTVLSWAFVLNHF